MRESADPRFFLTNLEIVMPTGKFTAEALVSPFGVSRIILPVSLQAASTRALANFDGFSAEVQLVRQFTEAGVSFSARFDKLTPEQKEFLRLRVAAAGVLPGWVRRFPRISVSQLAVEEDPHPSFCLIAWQGKDYRLTVANFTLDGLRLVYRGELPKLRVGTMLTITVYSSVGSGLSGLEAEVRNFSLVQGSDVVQTTEVGLKFRDSRSPASESYRGLIRDCLVSMKQRKA